VTQTSESVTLLYGFRDTVNYLSKIGNFSHHSCLFNAPVRMSQAEFRSSVFMRNLERWGLLDG